MLDFFIIWAAWFAIGRLLPRLFRHSSRDIADARFLAIPMWALWCVVSLIGFVLGLPIVAVMACFPRYVGSSTFYPDKRVLACFPVGGIFAPWENWEDGIDGLPILPADQTAPQYAIDHVQFQQWFWGVPTAAWSRWRRIFVWSALRNSFNNQRFLWPFCLVIDPSRTHIRYFRGNSAYFVWQGAFSALYLTLGTRYIHIGYKFHQDDAEGSDTRVHANYVVNLNHGVPGHPRTALDASDARAPGAGFVFDILKKVDPTSWQTPRSA